MSETKEITTGDLRKCAVALRLAVDDDAVAADIAQHLQWAARRIEALEGSLVTAADGLSKRSDALFAIWPEGITSLDVPKLEVLSHKPDASSAFFATAILQVLRKTEGGALKGIAPRQLVVEIKP